MPSPDLPRLILASQSPRRAELLGRLGLAFEIVPASIDESYRPGELPAEHAERLAREKAVAIAGGESDAIVIGSDTIVVIDGVVLGKPRDDAHAVEMLGRLSGRSHEVFTAVAVAYRGLVSSATERVGVHFRALDLDERRAYVATGEAADKAGAYGIQGFGSALVAAIDGDYFAVVGLPVVRTLDLLRRAGWHYAFGEGLHALPSMSGHEETFDTPI